MKYVWILLLVAAQLTIEAQPKKPGDRLPEVRFNGLLNGPQKSFDLKTCGADLLLVEIWSTSCGGCLKSIPLLAALREKFAGRLAVMLLAAEGEKAAKDFLQKRPDYAAFGLPFSPLTQQWKEWFPQIAVPHFIWLTKSGRVEAVTETKYVTEANITELLQNGKINLPVKSDMAFFPYYQPMLMAKNGQDILFHSALTGPISGIATSAGYTNLDKERRRVHAYNQTVRSLYEFAYRHQVRFSHFNRQHQMIFDLSDSSLLEKDRYGDEKEYCYELVLKRKAGEKPLSFFAAIQADLDRYFNFHSQAAKKRMRCLVLSNLNTNDVAGETDDMSDIGNLTMRKLRHVSAKGLVSAIEDVLLPNYPLLWEGPDDRKISVQLKPEYAGWEELEKDLRKAGISLVLEERELDIIYITDKEKDRH